MSEIANFEFESIEDVDDALQEIRWTGPLDLGDDTHDEEVPKHIWPLIGLGEQLESSNISLANAVKLAKGHRRLVVVLLEPSDPEDWTEIDEMDEWPATIEEIDWLLSDASDGKLGFPNTCVFDIRPLRFRYIRTKEPATTRQKYDELAYKALEKMVTKLKPDVIVCCQCNTFDATNPTAKMLCSRMRQAGEVEVREIAGKSTRVVYGFHPSMYLSNRYLQAYTRRKGLKQDKIEETADMLQDLLRLSFHVAINELAGREVKGNGIRKLKEAVAILRPPLAKRNVVGPLVTPAIDLAEILRRTERIQISDDRRARV